MQYQNFELSPKTYAHLAGLMYLIIIICGIFAEFFVRMDIIVPGDALTTSRNIVQSGMLFGASYVADLIMITTDVALAMFLYVLFKPVSKTFSLLAAFFRLAQAAALSLNLLNQFAAGLVLNGSEYLSVFSKDQLDSLAYLFLELHNFGYYIALVFFAAHCLVIGFLMFKSGYFPALLGGFMIIASFSYFIGSFGVILFPGYEEIVANSAFYVGPAVIAEFSVCLWLLFKGINVKKWPTEYAI